MKIINLTPHDVILLNSSNYEFSPRTRSYVFVGENEEEQNPIAIYKAVDGVIPRCTQSEKLVDNVNGINVYKMVFGEVENLPEREEDTYYIVSSMVAQSCPEREDLLIPAHLVRNDKGQVIGCLAFSRI